MYDKNSKKAKGKEWKYTLVRVLYCDEYDITSRKMSVRCIPPVGKLQLTDQSGSQPVLRCL